MSKSDGDFFSNPEAFSPLYIKLYENLSHNKKPLYYKEADVIKCRKDIRKCSSTFDRYLCALYPSHFEASNPFEIEKEKLNEKSLLDYLNSEYKRPYKDLQSYNIDREIKKILSFLDEEDASRLKVDAKSAIYKLLVLSYKLSLVNNKWRKLIQLLPLNDMKNASMDNIVDFNENPISNARENSALIKTFYYEMDQGKTNGDKTQSKRIIQIPFYINILDYVISISIESCKDISSMHKKSNDLIDYFKNIIICKNKKRDVYDDKNQELFDLIQTSVIINTTSNEVLSRLKIINENNGFFPYVNNKNKWIEKEQTIDSIAKNIESEFNIDFKNEWWELSETLFKILTTSLKYQIIPEHLLRNVCCLLICQIFLSNDKYVRSNIYGAKRNTYNVYNELIKFNEWMIKNNKNDCKNNLSWMRQSSIYFFKYKIDILLWNLAEKNKPNNIDYSIIAEICNLTLHKIIAEFSKKNHRVCLNSIEFGVSSITDGNISNIADLYLRSWKDDLMYSKLKTRESIYWTPLKKIT